MKKNWIVISLVFLITCLAVTRPVHAAPLLVPTAQELIDAVNAYRASNGLAPLVIDSLLMISAQTHAEYLASQSGTLTGHAGIGGTDADARAAALGYPQVPGLDINENWANLPASADLDFLLFTAWGDSQHTHTMLHTRGQHVGAGVAVSGDNVIYVLNVAAFWGDAGLTVQPTSGAYPGISGGNSTGASISQYIAPVEMAEPDENGKVMHQVLQGQTLWSIATTYGVTIDQICQLNDLTSESMIYTGQKLLIKMVPTPSLVPTITIGIHLENQFPVVTTTAPLLTAQPSTIENRQSLSDQWVIMGIIVVAIIGFALIFLGQRSSQ